MDVDPKLITAVVEELVAEGALKGALKGGELRQQSPRAGFPVLMRDEEGEGKGVCVPR